MPVYYVEPSCQDHPFYVEGHEQRCRLASDSGNVWGTGWSHPYLKGSYSIATRTEISTVLSSSFYGPFAVLSPLCFLFFFLSFISLFSVFAVLSFFLSFHFVNNSTILTLSLLENSQLKFRIRARSKGVTQRGKVRRNASHSYLRAHAHNLRYKTPGPRAGL